MRGGIAGAIGPTALVLVTLWPQPAPASEAEELMGVWQQVGSDAGACPACGVTFRADGQGLSVMANNGWSATLHGSGGGFEGDGRWSTGRSWVSGRPFTIRFRQERERLDMTMTVEMEAGRTRVVRAAYRRAWQGV